MEDCSGIYHDGGLERNYRDGPKLNAYRVHTSLAQRAELNYTWRRDGIDGSISLRAPPSFRVLSSMYNSSTGPDMCSINAVCAW